MWQLVFLTLSCDLAVATAHSGSRKGMDIAAGKKQYQVQHGACSYTFQLPETDRCRPPPSAYLPSAVQRDAPLDDEDSAQRLQALESILENNTQWLMKVDGAPLPARRRRPARAGRAGGPDTSDERPLAVSWAALQRGRG